VPAFDAGVGFDPALGHGRLGGVGFRESALPVVVHITDAMTHDAADYAGFDVDAHDAVAAFAALDGLGARILGVRTGAGARGSAATDLLGPLGMAVATDAVVPLCAFDGSAPRTAGTCTAAQCCTGIDGAGVAPEGGACPLVFDTSDTGTGLGDAVVTGIEALSRFATYELAVVVHDDPSDAVDATCFIDSLAIDAAEPPAGACSVTPVPTDTDGDTLADTLVDATPRTQVTFELEVVNQDLHDVDGDGNTTESCAGPGRYGLVLELTADGRTVVSTRAAAVVVP
jgi:hypothetical protein